MSDINSLVIFPSGRKAHSLLEITILNHDMLIGDKDIIIV